MAKRVLMLGLDALVANLVEKFAEEGILPNLQRLIDGGCFTRLLSAIPAQTPTNWHTVATGAAPGTHSVVVWGAHRPGDPVPEVHRGEAFNSGLCPAEYIWETAARAGKRSVVMNYAGYPPTTDAALHIDRLFAPTRSYYDVALPTVYHNLETERGDQIQFSEARGWAHLPESARPPLEAEIEVMPSAEGRGPVYRALLVARGGGYDTLVLCADRDASAPITSLAVGGWSDWVRAEFTTDETGTCEAAFRFKLIECSPDGGRVRLFRTEAYPTDGRFVSEPAVGRKLVEALGPYQHVMMSVGLHLHGELIDWETADELLAGEAEWWAEAARMAMDETGAELLYLHYHLPDHVGHAFQGWIDPTGASYTPERAQRGWRHMRDYYGAMDRFVGEFLRRFEPTENVVAVVAEHGMPANKKAVSLVNAFRGTGWLKLSADGQGVVWSESKVWYDQNHLWINLEGREPTGVVPSAQYESLRAEVQALMRDLKDPETGEHVLSFVLTREEAPMVGLVGEHVGDLVFCYAGGYRWSSAEVLRLGEERMVFPCEGGNHGPMICTYETEVSSVYGLLALAGPGVRAAVREEPSRKGCRRTVDVAPTLAHLLGLGIPAQSEGRVLHEFLEGVPSDPPSRRLTSTARKLAPARRARARVQLKGDVTDEGA
jgi:predicted AlkP superfamily phosphohydrolase/phosphomutase